MRPAAVQRAGATTLSEATALRSCRQRSPPMAWSDAADAARIPPFRFPKWTDGSAEWKTSDPFMKTEEG